MLQVYKLHEDVEIPKYATHGSACFDIKAFFSHTREVQIFTPFNQAKVEPIGTISNERVFRLFAGERALIPTGMIFDIPPNYSVRMHIRSSVAVKRGLMLVNSEGVIDSDYVEECFIPVYNASNTRIDIKHGERLSQCELVLAANHMIKETEKRPTSESRNGGFGSTGV